MISVTENRNTKTLSYQIIFPNTLFIPIGCCLIRLWSSICLWYKKMNVHWFRITKPFVYRITSIFVGAQVFLTQFRQISMSAEEPHDIFSLLYTIYLVLLTIQITKNSINIPNLLVSEACLNEVSLSVLGPISFFLYHCRPIQPIH